MYIFIYIYICIYIYTYIFINIHARARLTMLAVQSQRVQWADCFRGIQARVQRAGPDSGGTPVIVVASRPAIKTHVPLVVYRPSLETNQGRIDFSFSQLPIECYLPEEVPVGD